jgi:hypothetical protein
MQWKILFSDRNIVGVISHPLILFGLVGQLILLWSALFSRTPAWVTYVGIGMLAVVVLLILLAGSLSANARMILSVLPFLALAVWHIYRTRRHRAS